MGDVALYNGLTQDQLLEAMGVQTQSEDQKSGNRLPILKINYQEEDDNGNELKKGAFALTLPSGTVYGKDVKVRVFADYMQYLDYDAGQEMVVNKTIIHRAGDEPIDETGGIRCGKPTSSQLSEMGDTARDDWRHVTCFRYLYSTVTITDATTAEGEAVEVQNEPCLLRLKGASFLSFSDDVVKACNSQRIKFMQVDSQLVTERKKRGSVTYFVVNFKPDFSNIMELNTDDLQFMSKILDTVNAENKQIIGKHNAALRQKQGDAMDETVVAEVEGYLEEDFEESA